MKLAAFSGALILSVMSVAQSEFDKTLLSPGSGYTSSRFHAISDNGNLAGWGQTANGVRGVVRVNGQFRTLPPVAGSMSWANDINDAGYSAGWTSQSGFASYYGRAAIYPPEGVGQVAVLPAQGLRPYSYAYGINSKKQIVGRLATDKSYVSVDSSGDLAFIAVVNAFNGVNFVKVKTLTLGGTASTAFGINEDGTVVGGSGTVASSNFWRAFIFVPTEINGYVGVLKRLPTPGGERHSVAFGVNAGKDACGWMKDDQGARRATVWKYNAPTPLVLPSLGGFSQTEALDINDAGEVVGIAYNPSGSQVGFFWDERRGIRILNQVTRGGGDISYVEGINNWSQIAGVNGSTGAVLDRKVAVLLVHGLWSNAQKWNEEFRDHSMGLTLLSRGFETEAVDFPLRT